MVQCMKVCSLTVFNHIVFQFISIIDGYEVAGSE